MSTSPNPYRELAPDRIVETVARLQRRIHERFPNSGLSKVAGEVTRVAERTAATAAKIGRPYVLIRLLACGLVGAIGAVLGAVLFNLDTWGSVRDLPTFIQVLDSALASVVFLGATIIFLVTLERRFKRERTLKAIQELRSLAHIIDMHQLTKTPDRVLGLVAPTRSSPEKPYTVGEMGRYLDYCSELLSMIGKLAVLYVEHFPDSSTLEAVDQIEDLTTGLSRKIWQKLDILNRMATLAPTSARGAKATKEESPSTA